MRGIVALVAGAVLAGTVAPTPAFQAELAAYREALSRVCSTGVTPELLRLYETTLRTVQAAQPAPGPTNFAGPLSPDRVYETTCIQGR
jgi:hypothetical protein